MLEARTERASSLTNLFIHFNRLPAGINLSNIAQNLRLNPIRQTAQLQLTKDINIFVLQCTLKS